MTKNAIHEKSKEPLVNYLRAHRRKAGLTQSDLARIIGYGNDVVISRHEGLDGIPPLLIALTYQIVFRVHVSEMFVGLTQTVEIDVEARLAEFEEYLGKQSARGPRAAAIARKLEWLSERRSSGYQ
jgi:DNA-binding XRE family transcriptional regulator